MELFTGVNLVFESAAHDLFPDFFDTLDKQTFQIIFLYFRVGLIWNQFFLGRFVLFNNVFKLSDQLIIISF